ncbi:hypothetical protein OJF2_77960 [Aquisphaera giovannonii]|uniref:Uncharacterized protein n=1 Tax=Aquisphaera giovannonii TaxID=406548 RepID=A0A5B9WG64_9BACT|nr:hypothetical protein [Aquisphaera giovannonii]QEH39184.1 hypothetical protein OJF2_77960 [Aquisphaera giovannonii]
MNRAVEIHDATLAAIEVVGRDVVLRLAPAYVHSCEGRPGIEAGLGAFQDVTLILREAAVELAPASLPCTLIDGSLSATGVTWDNVFPLPLASPGPATFSAVAESGEPLVVRGAGVEAMPSGEPRHAEPFPGQGA